jgi:hypothetical protein
MIIKNKRFHILLLALLLVMAASLNGCKLPGETDDSPNVPSLPTIPSLSDLPDLLDELGLPDLSNIANLPQLSDLPALQVPDGSIAFAGPTERRINPGEWIPGTDIQLIGLGENGADFQIEGMHVQRRVGDSLDYDGTWRGASDVEYTLRLRIYLIGENYVRVAGVHRVVIGNIQPSLQPVNVDNPALTVPYTGSADLGSTIKGITYTYMGPNERGAELGGLGDGEYPYRKQGDSITWIGLLRPDIPARFDLRVIRYSDNSLQTAGTVKLKLPEQ